MPKIHQLSQSIINKIAAGEVIERPASVVKELVENAVDAGATRIDITVEAGGRDMVRVVDNGHGIPNDQLLLALASHATSKLQDADDLFKVATLGFRGEALASIAEISQTVLRSRTHDSHEGAELRSDGGQLSDVTPCGCPVGTSIEVRNLFFNTPVRRKFLKTTQTELGHITEAVNRIAMPNPQVHFTLRHNQRTVLDLAATASQAERIGQIAGRAIGERLIEVESNHGDVRLSGLVAHPSQSRSNTKMQFVFLNGRHIRDRQLQHALGEAFRGLLTSGRQPIAFLFLEMPPELCDVNVHPTKLEVRFQDGSKLYSQLLSTLRSKFLKTDMTVRIESGPDNPESPDGALNHDSATTQRQQVLDWAKGENTPQNTGFSDSPIRQPGVASRGAAPIAESGVPGDLIVPSADGFTPADGFSSGTSWDASADISLPDELPPGFGSGQQGRLGQPAPSGGPINSGNSGNSGGVPRHNSSGGGYSGSDGSGNSSGSLSLHSIDRSDFQPFPNIGGGSAKTPVDATSDQATPPPVIETAKTPPARFMQVHNRYIVTENAEGLVVIDQHALHERILYEKLKHRINSGPVQSQKLLVPEPVDLNPTDRALVMEHLELLGQLGLKVEPFGGDTLLITAHPTMMSQTTPAACLIAIVEQLAESGKTPDRAELMESLLQSMSCKAAIKAGDPLTPTEIQSLLDQQSGVDDCHHCPHGRPSTLIFSVDQLDKQFKRS